MGSIISIKVFIFFFNCRNIHFSSYLMLIWQVYLYRYHYIYIKIIKTQLSYKKGGLCTCAPLYPTNMSLEIGIFIYHFYNLRIPIDGINKILAFINYNNMYKTKLKDSVGLHKNIFSFYEREYEKSLIDSSNHKYEKIEIVEYRYRFSYIFYYYIVRIYTITPDIIDDIKPFKRFFTNFF